MPDDVAGLLRAHQLDPSDPALARLVVAVLGVAGAAVRGEWLRMRVFVSCVRARARARARVCACVYVGRAYVGLRRAFSIHQGREMLARSSSLSEFILSQLAALPLLFISFLPASSLSLSLALSLSLSLYIYIYSLSLTLSLSLVPFAARTPLSLSRVHQKKKEREREKEIFRACIDRTWRTCGRE